MAKVLPLVAFIALIWSASAEHGVEAVHLYKEGSSMHEQGAFADTHLHRQPEWKHVVPITKYIDFHDVLRNEPLALVFFYTPWSFACLEFYDDLDQVAEKLKALRPAYLLVLAVDLTVIPDLGKEFRVNSLPTFSAFRYGVIASPAENNFPRAVDLMVNHMLALMKPAVHSLETREEAKSMISPVTLEPVCKPVRSELEQAPLNADALESTVIVAYLKDNQNQAIFSSCARLMTGQFRFMIVAENHIAKMYNAEFESIVIYRRWGAKTPIVLKTTEGKLTLGEASVFIIYNAIAPMQEFDELSKPLYMQRQKPLLVYFATRLLADDDPRFAALSNIQEDPALNVTVTQTNPHRSGRHVASFLGMERSLLRRHWAIGLLVGRKKYRFDDEVEDFTEASVRSWIKAVKADEWPEYHKSERQSIIAPTGSGQVSDLAFNTFQQDVIEDDAKDIIILLYNPENQPCLQLLPVFDALADSLKGVSGLLVARMNILENDYHDAYVIPGVPSIMYAKRTNKLAPIRFGGVARTVDNLKSFIEEHAAVSLGNFAPSNQTPSQNLHPAADVTGKDEL